MYEIRFKISDAKLASALTALKGLTFNTPSVTVDEDVEYPVSPSKRGPYNKAKRKKPLIPGSQTRKGEGAVRIVRENVAKYDVGAKFTAREMSDACAAEGYTATTYSHGLQLLSKGGFIKKLGFGHYKVLKKISADPQQAEQS